MTIDDLPDTIALFPLAGAVLLPRMHLPLNIFEPRYLCMLNHILKTDHRLIGIVQPVHTNGNHSRNNKRFIDNPHANTNPKYAQLYNIGCAGRLTSFSETEDKRYLITLSGITRYCICAISNTNTNTPYIQAQVDWQPFAQDLHKDAQTIDFAKAAFMDLLQRFFDHYDLAMDWDNMNDADDELLINALSILCPFENDEKQALLEAHTLHDRLHTLTALIECALHNPQHTKQRNVQ